MREISRNPVAQVIWELCQRSAVSVHEFSKQHEVSLEFTDRDVPTGLPREISLCLFRVVQEAEIPARFAGEP